MSISTRGGRVPADERARLVATHGPEKAARMIAEEEARYHPAPTPAARRKPTNNGLKPRGRKPAAEALDPAPADPVTPIPDSESEE